MFCKSGAVAGHMAGELCVATLHVFARTIIISKAIVQSRFSSFWSNQKLKMYLRAKEENERTGNIINIIMI